MQNRFMQAVIGLACTLCLSAYATAQTTPPPPEPGPPAAEAGAYQVKATLLSAQEVTEPQNSTLAGGEVTLEFDAGLTQAAVTLTLESDAAAATAAHFHCGRAGTDGSVAVGLIGPGLCAAAQLATGALTCALTNTDFSEPAGCEGVIDRPINNIASLFFALRDGLVYANIHASTNTSGEIRGQLIESGSTDVTTPPTVPPPIISRLA